MKKIFLTIILIVSIINLATAQIEQKDFTELSYMRDSIKLSQGKGKVTVYQDSKFESLMNNFVIANKLKSDKIWRVQIFFGIGREARFRAENIINVFKRKNPGIPTYLVFEEPHFKVKVGDFETKLEAERLKYQLEKEYGTLFITEDTELE